MSRIAVPAREAAPAAAQPLLDAVEKQLGVVPNLYRLIALSPAVLQGALGLSGALAKSASDPTAKAAVAFAAAVTRARPGFRRRPGRGPRRRPRPYVRGRRGVTVQ